MNKPVVLVTGFGPFPGVADNISGDVACALDGVESDSVRMVGRLVQTSFAQGPKQIVALAKEHHASAVMALGVASNRTAVCVETRAVYVQSSKPDVYGVCETGLPCREPELLTRPMASFATSLGAELSTDAGTYVCNATLYQLLVSCAQIPVVFVHLPPNFDKRELSRLVEAAGVLVQQAACDG